MMCLGSVSYSAECASEVEVFADVDLRSRLGLPRLELRALEEVSSFPSHYGDWDVGVGACSHEMCETDWIGHIMCQQRGSVV